MGIKDITLSSNAAPVGIPTPPPLEEILQSGTQSPLSQNPMSGSILKILAENGFKQKIEDGFNKGHTYTLLHSAPSKDFTLIDTWNETRVDESGNTITVPRKKYQIFTISGMESTATPLPATIPPESTPTEPNQYTPTPGPVSSVDDLPEETTAQSSVSANKILTEIPLTTPTTIETDTSRAKIIAEKIKKGGAGMTPEDWQFRNENWPLIEAELSPKAAAITTPAAQSQPIAQQTAAPTTEKVAEDVAVVEPAAVQVSVPITETPSLSTTQTTPARPTMDTPPAKAPTDIANPKLIPQHYDSRAWLMKKLKRSSDQSISETSQATKSPSNTNTPSSTSSYDLLKKRFSQNQSLNTPATSGIVPVTPPTEATPDPASRMKHLIESFFGTEPAIWDIVKSIPARAFIYPSEYAWGTDEQGRIIEKTLEDYPLAARKFREKIAQSIEEAATQGTLIETTPVGDVVNTLFNKGIL